MRPTVVAILIVNGCSCVLGGGRCFFRFSIFVKFIQKPAKSLQKKVFNSSLTLVLSEFSNLPSDVSTHTCKTNKPLTCNSPIVTWISGKNTQKGPWCALEGAGQWDSQIAWVSRARSSADRVAGSVDASPTVGAAAASVSLGVGVWLATSSACGGGGLLRCFRPPPPSFATAPWLLFRGIRQMCCDLVRCLPGAE